MEGFDATTYGRAFADVYDDWYADVTDVHASVATLADLALDGRDRARVLELGVGTGRLAVPLAVADERLTVIGVDTSVPMLDLLAARDRDGRVEVAVADMVTGLPEGPFDLVFVAYNTLFNLTADGEQERCFAEVAHRLGRDGRFLIEAFVPDDPPPDGDDISIRTMTADRVVLSISRQRGAEQRAEGQFVELTERDGVRLRPWSIRYASPAQLDDYAAAAGLRLEHRWADIDRTPFDDDHDRHVSVYRRDRHD